MGFVVNLIEIKTYTQPDIMKTHDVAILSSTILALNNAHQANQD